MTVEEINHRFKYHAPDANTRELHANTRDAFRVFALALDALSELNGNSRELSLAVTKLEEAAFWTHAHIARNITKE